MLFVGHTRFSLYSPSSSAWKASNGSRFKTEEEYRQYLFSDERLKIRMRIFLNLSMPQLANAIGDHSVQHLVSYSDLLPAKYEEQLIEAADRFDFIRLAKESDGTQGTTVETVAHEMLMEQRMVGIDPYQPFGVYRLDDDDLLPIDYFDRSQKYLSEPFIGMRISHASGLTAIYDDGKFLNARICHKPMLAIGFMGIHRFDSSGRLLGPQTVAHNHSDRAHPVILDSSGLGYVWTRHIEQDTTLGHANLSKDRLLARIKNDIDQYPVVSNFTEVHEAFPVLKDHISVGSELGSGYKELVQSQLVLTGTEELLELDALAGYIAVKIDVTCDANSELKNALLRFILIDEDGNRLDGTQHEDYLQNQPISRSPNESIGWYRYIKTRPGKNSMRIQFELPEGVFLGAVAVRKWKNMKSVITLDSLTVEN